MHQRFAYAVEAVASNNICICIFKCFMNLRGVYVNTMHTKLNITKQNKTMTKELQIISEDERLSNSSLNNKLKNQSTKMRETYAIIVTCKRKSWKLDKCKIKKHI